MCRCVVSILNLVVDYKYGPWQLERRKVLATGGGDAVVNIWSDSIAVDKEEAFNKEDVM
ncbi:hypothetical protein BVRB_015050 isoform B [Beta vulgaris subsp. vulgaris]|uniref:Uncharacterized protein n=1 Tax=Beta vulgaris subsp. vulgaris TaxID=3555 RepID=A0A0J8B1E6_BETVV|nr:hypothetical protein BVRB_015050 isoform B [Beta vulgaris subsp. vulgaris]